VVYEQDIDRVFPKVVSSGRTGYPSLTIAGGLLYASGSDGATVVIRPGPQFEVVAQNTLEPFRSSLFFDDRRIYIRGLKNLYCIEEN
jgi:hypothetical protein